jgi:hypothetical protein
MRCSAVVLPLAATRQPPQRRRRSRLQWRFAACGSAETPLAASGVSYDANLKITQWMRAHRVSNFPEPSACVAGEGRGGFSIQADVNRSSEPRSNRSASADRRTPAAAQTCRLSAGHPAPASEA